MDDLQISQPELKALSSGSRAKILKLLAERKHTLSELAAKIGMAPPTVKQHTTVLSGAGMVELIDEGRKWKYYSLTPKGRGILGAQHNQANIMLLLSSTLVVALAIFGAMFLQPIGGNANTYNSTDNAMQAVTANETYDATAAGDSSPKMVASKAAGRCTAAFTYETSTSPNAGISSGEYAALKCREAQTEQDCLAVDNYNADTNSLKSDGKPDCEWTVDFAAK